MTLADFVFYVFSAILLVSAVMVITSRNPVHSVLFLIVSFLNAAVLFLIAGAQFLAMVLAIVYVGAVAVLFLFVVMMLDVDFTALREGFQRYAPVGLAVGLVLAVELLMLFAGFTAAPAAMALRLSPMPGGMTDTHALGSVLYTNYLILFQLAGCLLLVAMIGAIVLTLRDRRRGRTQDISRQLARTPAITLSYSRPALGAGAALPPEPEPEREEAR